MSLPDILLRHAFPSDKGAIIWFLNQHWGSRHPLVNLPDLFEYYYVNGDKLQFVLAFEDGRMVAVAGYILANRSDTPDAWVSIWCAAGGANGVGLQLMEALPRLANIRVLACNNIRPKTMAFYRFLGWHADRISHYYRLADQSRFSLVQNPGDQERLPAGGDLALFPVYSTVALEGLGSAPHRSVPPKGSVVSPAAVFCLSPAAVPGLGRQ